MTERQAIIESLSTGAKTGPQIQADVERLLKRPMQLALLYMTLHAMRLKPRTVFGAPLDCWDSRVYSECIRYSESEAA